MPQPIAPTRRPKVITAVVVALVTAAAVVVAVVLFAGSDPVNAKGTLKRRVGVPTA